MNNDEIVDMAKKACYKANSEKTIYPEKNECYCCHKVKEGYLIPINNGNIDCEHKFVCISCNHLEPKNKQEK